MSYSSKDITPYSGVSYYRLTQVNLDGTSSNKLQAVLIDEVDDKVKVFPTRIFKELKIIGDGVLVEDFHLVNSAGQKVKMNVIVTGEDVVVVDLSLLAGGVYFVIGKESVHKVIKE